MVGIVLVSHVATVADGAAELARQMGGTEVRIEPAGGLDDGSIGTDAERVRAAIERAASEDGVLVLMDLGSALMSAEMAIEMLGGDPSVRLTDAPLVEGAVAAAAAARGGAGLEQVAAEARGALAMKESQLADDAESGLEAVSGRVGPAVQTERPAECEARVRVPNAIGLHARPAARVVALAAGFDAVLQIAKIGGPGPVSARSLVGLMTLAARLGDELVATASGPQASEAVEAFVRLAEQGFGEGVVVQAEAPSTGPAAEPSAAEAPPAPSAGTWLEGMAASPGLALAPAHPLHPAPASVPLREPESPAAERRRLDEARAVAREAITADRERLAARGAVAEAAIFDAHLALLDDEALLGPAAAAIESGESAEDAWEHATREVAATYRGFDDPLLRERAADVEDVGGRVLVGLNGASGAPAVESEAALVAAEFTPAVVASLNPDLVRALASARGTPTAHASILARALGLPAVVGLGEAVLAVTPGTLLFVDGERGAVQVAPPPDQLRAARLRIERGREAREAAGRRALEPAITRDGKRIEVSANVGAAGDLAGALELGADGVGLLRTEFMFLDRAELPSEEEQEEALEEIAARLDGRPLIVRTLDVGGDKPLPGMPSPPEDNPFLGQRGIRLSLATPGPFEAQLRAILRVAARHPLKIMFPMVAGLDEVRAAIRAMERAHSQAGVEAAPEVGIMVEVPAAALVAGQLARFIDFFSIGTNDLAQYTMAAERGNPLVAPLLAGPHPALLKLVRDTVAGAATHRRWVGVCGELAGDPAAALLLVGLGVRELSCAPPLIPGVKAALREVSLTEARAAAERALAATDADAARQAGAALLDIEA
jgi:phosphoenolpyruvate-protein phosphotransferase/dihydroxyacetone kinase phosphotransfer subunit